MLKHCSERMHEALNSTLHNIVTLKKSCFSRRSVAIYKDVNLQSVTRHTANVFCYHECCWYHLVARDEWTIASLGLLAEPGSLERTCTQKLATRSLLTQRVCFHSLRLFRSENTFLTSFLTLTYPPSTSWKSYSAHDTELRL